MHLNMLNLEHLKKVRQEDQKSTYDTRYEQPVKNDKGTRHVRSTNTLGKKHARHDSTQGT